MKYCQSEIEDGSKCKIQCEHCKLYYKPLEQHITNWKQRYNEAHYSKTLKTAPNFVKDGHYTNPTLPKYKTANGLTKLICNFLNWTNSHAERTNNMGVPIKKNYQKFNILSGQLVTIDNGIEWRKGTGIKGTSDIKGHINNPNYKFPIPIYIELKIGKDTMKEEQEQYEKQVTKTGALYCVVKTPENFFIFYDFVMNL